MMNTKQVLAPMPGRPTIGFLTPDVHSALVEMVWLGAFDAAQDCQVNLLYIPGESIHDQNPFRAQANVLYTLITPAVVDGLILWTSSLGSYLSAEEFHQFYASYQPRPIISIGKAFPGIPTLSVNSYSGTRELLHHLIEMHGYRRLAFLRGTESHPGAQQRYHAYCDALRAYAIPFASELVTPPLEWQSSADVGSKALRILFDERRLRPQYDVDVLVAASDKLAIEALHALRTRGIRVPDDLAVVGCNNSPESRVVTPPLTTVNLPFYEQGYEAVKSLLALMEGASVPEVINVYPKLIVRRSCGCFTQQVVDAAIRPIVIKADEDRAAPELSLSDRIMAQRTMIMTAIQQVIGVSDHTAAWAGALIEAFLEDLTNNAPTRFLTTLDTILSEVAANAGSLDTWHGGLSALICHIRPWLPDSATVLKAESLWQQARTLVGETIERFQAFRQIRIDTELQALRALETALSTSFDTSEIMNILATGLPALGIRRCYLSLYDSPEPYQYPQAAPRWSRLRLACDQQRLDLPPDGQRFLSQELIPPGLLSNTSQSAFIIESLYFKHDQLGFVVFAIGSRTMSIYKQLRERISTALYGALLVERVREHSAELTRQKSILDTFLETVPARIFFKNQEGQIIRANKAYAARYGFPDPSAILGKTDFDLLSPERARIMTEHEQQICATGQPQENREAVYTGGDGQQRWSLVTKMPLRDEHDNIIGIFGISTDITQLKQTEMALQEARNIAEEARQVAETANQAKSEFLANMSHELRTPLNAILGYAQLLIRERHLSPEVTEEVAIIQRSGEHLLTLINDILDLSKIEARKMELHPVPINFPEFLAEIVEMMRLHAQNKGLLFIADLDENLPNRIFADETRLRQVLLNLSGNAIKFTTTGTVTLYVKNISDPPLPMADVTPPQSQSVPPSSPLWTIHFEVADTGIGIPAEFLSRIFLPFEQVGDVLARASGSGLGLTISQRIAELMGGTIHVNSQVGIGTAFWMDLTFPEPPVPVSGSAARQPRLCGYHGPRQTVLIVDDHVQNRNILRIVLESIGFVCLEAENGEQGIAVASAHRPCVMLIDLVMTGINGFETARRIRQRPELSNTVLVAVSASAFDQQIEQSRQAGYAAFIAKPVDIQELLSILARHLPLEWIYEEEPPTTLEPCAALAGGQETLLAPPLEILRKLHSFAVKGDLFGIKAICAESLAGQTAYQPFIKCVMQLAAQYRDVELMHLLEQALNDAVKPSVTNAVLEESPVPYST